MLVSQVISFTNSNYTFIAGQCSIPGTDGEENNAAHFALMGRALLGIVMCLPKDTL